jgi:hypothetical protein
MAEVALVLVLVFPAEAWADGRALAFFVFPKLASLSPISFLLAVFVRFFACALRGQTQTWTLA